MHRAPLTTDGGCTGARGAVASHYRDERAQAAAEDGAVPLGVWLLGAWLLGAVPLGAVPLGAVPLGAVPLGAVPLGAVPPAGPGPNPDTVVTTPKLELSSTVT